MHFIEKNDTFFQVPLSIGKRNIKLVYFADSNSIYDPYFELLPKIYKKLVPDLGGYDFEVDLLGQKPFNQITTKYLLTSKKGSGPIMTFGLYMKPMEMNIIENIRGDTFRLEEKSTLTASGLFYQIEKTEIFNYFFGKIPVYVKMKNVCLLISKKIQQLLGK